MSSPIRTQPAMRAPLRTTIRKLKVHWRAIAVNVSNSVDNAEGAMQAPAPSAIHRNVIAQAADGRPVVRMFSSQCYEEAAFSKLMDNYDFHLQYYNTHLDDLSVELTEKADVVIVFVNDKVDRHILKKLADSGTKAVALRCAGFNNVDLEAAQDLGIRVVRVPQYSPNSVAEHTIALILALNRNIHRAYNRVRDRNFSLRGLVGFDLKGKVAGVIGTGKIGALVARLLWHFRCETYAYDLYPDESLKKLGVKYADLETVLRKAEILSLNCPLTKETRHLIGKKTLPMMRDGVMIVNTGRGPLVDTAAVLEGLKSGKVGSLALDVYEEEERLFFEDHSNEILDDDVFARLLTFPNVLITAHQAFLTREALAGIAETTLSNVSDILEGRECPNEVKLQK